MSSLPTDRIYEAEEMLRRCIKICGVKDRLQGNWIPTNSRGERRINSGWNPYIVVMVCGSIEIRIGI